MTLDEIGKMLDEIDSHTAEVHGHSVVVVTKEIERFKYESVAIIRQLHQALCEIRETLKCENHYHAVPFVRGTKGACSIREDIREILSRLEGEK